MTQPTVELPNAALFARALADDLGEAKAAEIVQAAGRRYDELYAQRTEYVNRALRQHLEESILPGIALYQALMDDPDTLQRAMALVERVCTDWAVPNRQRMERLGRLPFYYTLMRVVIKPMMRVNFPAEGWETEWVENSGEAVAFNMRRCFYLDVLDSYGVPELTTQYCRMDDLVYDGTSSKVQWARTKTLGRGDDCCDFRFVRVKG
jgi:hypothetical protein